MNMDAKAVNLVRQQAIPNPIEHDTGSIIQTDPPGVRCDSIVLQEACVPDRSELVAIPVNTDGFTSNPWILNSSQHQQNVTHSSISPEESG